MKKILIVLVIAIILILVLVATMGSSDASTPTPTPSSTPVSNPKPLVTATPPTASKPSPAPSPSSNPVTTAATAAKNFCYRYAVNPMRTILYPSSDCTAKPGWGASDANVGSGGAISVHNTQQPGTEKYCYRNSTNPSRTLFYKSNDCSSKWGWGADDGTYGSGGEVFLYPTQQPNTEKYCYRYAKNPMRTLFYKSDDCSSKWGWGHSDANVGDGGEVWVPK